MIDWELRAVAKDGLVVSVSFNTLQKAMEQVKYPVKQGFADITIIKYINGEPEESYTLGQLNKLSKNLESVKSKQLAERL